MTDVTRNVGKVGWAVAVLAAWPLQAAGAAAPRKTGTPARRSQRGAAQAKKLPAPTPRKTAPVTAPPPKPAAAKPQPTVDHAPATWAEREDQVVRDINEIRSRHALPPLKADPRLAQVARDYSRRMALEKFFEHQSPTGDNIDNRLDAAAIPFISVGENLLDSEGVPQPWLTAAKHWMESEAHRESILDPEFTHTGVGMWQVGDRWLFVQIFLKPG